MIEQLRQLEQDATPGPWAKDAPMMSQRDDRYVGMLPHGDGYRHVMVAPDAETAELIAAMRNCLPALLDIAELAKRHHYHVNDEWERLAAMRPQDPVTWERWEAIRERLLDELAAALSRLEGATDVD